MQGSWTVLKRNCVNFFPACAVFAGESQQAFNTWLTVYNRGNKYGPTPFVEQAEHYSPDYWKRGHSQDENMWVDMKLSEEVSQPQLAQLIRYKLDFWRMAHIGMAPVVFGGYALPAALFWLSKDTWTPSALAKTAEEKREWHEAQDMYRYRSAPSFITDTKWNFDLNCYPFNAAQERGWDELFEKNDMRRDPTSVRAAAEMYDHFIPLAFIKRKTLRHLARSMNLPTFPMLTRLCSSNRIRQYWSLIWNEDHMVIQGKLHTRMSDEELQEFAWRRFLAPYDKNLSREQVMERVEDYFTFLGPKFVEEGKAPNVIILCNYVLGYYNDPAYLTEDIVALDANDFDHMAPLGKDAFMRRLEFENGPLRDQVEAHTQKIIEERAAAKAAEAPKVEA